MSFLRKLFGATAIDPEGRRLLGLSLESNRPIFAPKGHSLLLSANGGGKTTRGAMPWLFSFAASEPEKAILVLDSKNGEMAIQAAETMAKLGRKVAVIDDMGVWPELAPYRIRLNPFGAAVAAMKRDPQLVLFAGDTIANALIEEPQGDAKNKYFRAWPRTLIEFGMGVQLKRDPVTATPGAVSSILSDPEMLDVLASVEAEEGSGALKDQARAIRKMAHHEHMPQHLEEASRSIRLYSAGSRLHKVGNGATLTHEDLIREGYVIFLVGPQAYIDRLAPHYALHILAFCDALYNGAGPLRAICDEFSNTPLKKLVDGLTTLRAFGGEIHMIAQSRSEIIRKFGEQETRTIEENAVVKQWFGFSSFDEAERASKAINDEFALSTGLSGEAGGGKSQTSLSLSKQRILTPSQLMAMPSDQALSHVKSVGFFLHRTLSQNQIDPYCHLIGENPMEGGRLPPDPKITLTTPKVRT